MVKAEHVGMKTASVAQTEGKLSLGNSGLVSFWLPLAQRLAGSGLSGGSRAPAKPRRRRLVMSHADLHRLSTSREAFPPSGGETRIRQRALRAHGRAARLIPGSARRTGGMLLCDWPRRPPEGPGVSLSRCDEFISGRKALTPLAGC
ncbi:hypothetical protein AAFF_G00019610 [Aldrovandia affinis]|uniref:Uncharacterized protein n=1 Tax=Aldrovandia affinis TaxID=143900 RepID=A0AAD7S5P6_9TELE|nr:hypothetical protein AAFF_G00019610 [Aldrovandia affinis]